MPAVAAAAASRNGTSRRISAATKHRPQRHHDAHQHFSRRLICTSSGERSWACSRPRAAAGRRSCPARCRVRHVGAATLDANAPDSTRRRRRGRPAPTRRSAATRRAQAGRTRPPAVGDHLVAGAASAPGRRPPPRRPAPPARRRRAPPARAARPAARPGRAHAWPAAPGRCRCPSWRPAIARNSPSAGPPADQEQHEEEHQDQVEQRQRVLAHDARRRCGWRAGSPASARARSAAGRPRPRSAPPRSRGAV